MRYKFLVSFCFIWLTVGSIQAVVAATSDSTQIKKVLKIYQDVKSEYAPDGRTAIFQLTAQEDGRYALESSVADASQVFLEKSKSEQVDNLITRTNLPSIELGEQRYGIVNLSVVNLRTIPKNAAELATQALLGTPLDILKKAGNYYLVRTPDQYIAWLDAAAITVKTKNEINDWIGKPKLLFTDDYGHGYTEPNVTSERVSDLVLGNILIQIKKITGFYQVQYPDGRTAYVQEKQVTDYDQWATKINPKPEHVIEVAKSMLGIPYLWGGTSVKGVDCSGFTKTTFFMNGVVIPRDASQQVLVGQSIAILQDNELDLKMAQTNLLPGDLLFFAGGKQQSPHARVTHVALYIGNGEFIHAAGKVRVNSMNPEAANYDDFQTRTLVAARRYFGKTDTEGLSTLTKSKAYLLK